MTWPTARPRPSGDFALLVGSHADTVTEGVVFRLDDALLRGGAATSGP